MTSELLEVHGLAVDYPTRRGVFTAIEDVSFHVRAGEILGIVGESGAGKSTIGAAIMRLIDYPGYVREGQVLLKGEDLAGLSDAAMTHARGRRIGMIFQDPLTALNPVLTVGTQIRETLRKHTSLKGDAVDARAVELLTQVGIPEPERRLAQYPHQFSGGMRQRVVIAIALAGEPELLIADEPTTALDVSIQSEILALIKELCRKRNLGVILITHDMAVINEVTDRVAVMLHGHIVEIDTTRKIIDAPSHPYTQSLIAAVPRTDVKLDRFQLVEATAGGQSAVDAMAKDVAWLHGGVDNSAAREAGGDTPMVEVENLTVRFMKSRGVLARWNTYFSAVDDVS
ncbi:MAG: ABC transporter ATP-binding protein, partial [Alphaproteobacteria bacterium]